MIEMTASLFAHIQNDAFLTGTSALEGNSFYITARYLKEYLNSFKKQGLEIPPGYEMFLANLDSLIDLDTKMHRQYSTDTPPDQIDEFAGTIAERVVQLAEGASVLIPGGWNTSDVGHAMLYQLTHRVGGGYRLTVFNAGDGIRYHAKKSAYHKELYNPTKIWDVPNFDSDKDRVELKHFISRLLKPRLRVTDTDAMKPMTSNILYEEILPTISHLGGVEQDDRQTITPYMYTGGQLSGTCSQRVLHQMLKVNSESELAYQQFIFKFKHHALLDYVASCCERKCPYTPAVADQIRLAIENNLKILNTPGLFDEDYISNYLRDLESIKIQISALPFPTQKVWHRQEGPVSFVIVNSPSVFFRPNIAPMVSSEMKRKRVVDMKGGESLLETMDEALTIIRSSYSLEALGTLEKLILALPLNEDAIFNNGFYRELRTLEDFITFKQKIKALIQLLNTYVKKGPETPVLHVMALKLATLLADTKEEIARRQNLPLFKPFTDSILATFINSKVRNPFYATNHPGFDVTFKALQRRFESPRYETDHNRYITYCNDILKMHPVLNQALVEEYTKQFGSNTEDLHTFVRAKGIQSLYMLSQYNKGSYGGKYNLLYDAIAEHLDDEKSFICAFNPFLSIKRGEVNSLSVGRVNEIFHFHTSLFATWLPYQKQSTDLSKYKYAMQDSSALQALEQDAKNESTYHRGSNQQYTANEIQLKQVEKIQPVTTEDIEARDYFILRSAPAFQIVLTLDYFTRHIEKLADESNQRYIEANLFQPGLLLEALQRDTFFPQFERLITTGFRVFSQHDKHTRQSLVFVRLEYLVSRYLALTPSEAGLRRLQNNQADLIKQLALATDPDVIYVLQQYLFLTLITQIELGVSPDHLLGPALQAYFYLKSHTNPSLLEDAAHRAQVDIAIDTFKLLISSQSDNNVNRAVQSMVDQIMTNHRAVNVGTTLPVYSIVDPHGKLVCRADVMSGRLFENSLARSGVPLVIQHHPLIKQLGLQEVRECLMNQDETYMVLQREGLSFELQYKGEQLSVRQRMTMQSRSAFYNLRPLTDHHCAMKANPSLQGMRVKLPKMLTDGSMNFWAEEGNSSCGVLTQNNKPVYLLKDKKFYLLDEQGTKTDYVLTQPPSFFESNQFILAHQAPDGRELIKLPRYDLTFESQGGDLVYTKTGERVMQQPLPFHPSVAGMVLEKSGHTRVLVPVSRFYATKSSDDDASDFYPVVHDTQGIIADTSLVELWKNKPPREKPLWDYQNSERVVSFQLKNGEPVADTVADALYLAYIYLATNQTEKAWATLNDCKTRLGGLTGDPSELQFIAWICNDMPHCLPDFKKEAKRKTPPYVGCQLKAMSLLCDFLLEDQTFDLTVKRTDDTANTAYALLQQEHLSGFLKSLPKTIHNTLRRYQSMDRHLEHTYTLNTDEQNVLLTYYHDGQDSSIRPLGTLGYTWMTLSRDAIEQKREALFARLDANGTLSLADQNRLDHINHEVEILESAAAVSTILELVPIDLSLTVDTVEQEHLSDATKRVLETWFHTLPGVAIGDAILSSTLDKLTSSTSETDFLRDFPAYFQIACSNNEPLRKRLDFFCRKTLISQRHIPLKDQESNIPMLCNVLYRVLSEKRRFISGSAHKNTTLNDVIATCKDVSSLLPINVYQARDVYQELLEPPVEQPRHEPISLEPPVESPPHEPIPLKVSEPTGHGSMNDTILQALTDTQNQELSKILLEYKLSLKTSADGIVDLGRDLDSVALGDGSSEAKVARAYAIEKQAGALYFLNEQERKKLALRLMGSPDLARALSSVASNEQERLSQQREQSWRMALALANQGPDDPIKARSWHIARLAKGRKTLTEADLMSLYCQADLTKTMLDTGLNVEQAHELHNLIHTALVEGILEQAAQKISTKLRDTTQEGSETMALQALELLATDEIPGLDNPSIVIIQHEEKILLRDRQVSALKSLLKPGKDGKPFNETVEKIIMGGGKSKVILPILAERKAEGHNLVVIEVPQALLATNYVDLNRTSARLFGKKSYRLEYNRDTNSAPKKLKRLYRRLTDIMNSRGYLVTTGESIQSLELKYIELLEQEGEHDAVWEQQVYWLDKITNLFRHYADCIIDEAHLGLSINKKLNYTSGEAKSISTDLIKNATAFFSLMETKAIQEAPLLGIDYDWDAFKMTLARALVEDTNSPLNSLVAQAIIRYGDGVKQQLIDYCAGKPQALPEVVSHATDEEKEALAFFKQEITVLLPQTLPRRVDVNYGASKVRGLTPLERTLAIPYAASNVPSERSRFGHELEAINYATQMMLINGLSKAFIIEKIKEWQSLSGQQLLKDKGLTSRDQTPMAQGFSVLTDGLILSEMDVKDDAQMTAVHLKLQHNKTLIIDLLRDQCLPQIKQDSAIIHSDAFNHVDCYRTVQCVSGTPSNHPTYHQNLSHDKTSSLGSDGYILQILDHKETQVRGVDYDTVQTFVTDAIGKSHARERVRAIIDINATFKGAMNVDVAKEIAQYIRSNPEHLSQTIQHVLYFDDDQILYAIDVRKPDEPIFLGTSEESELVRLLGSSPGERFTYYDQAHTLGVDIQQARDSHALVMIDEKSTLQAFLQGTMRMRELSLDQTVELMVPERIKDISREALMAQLASNEQQALLKDNLFAAKGRMTNLIRRNLLSRVQDLPSSNAQEKSRLAQFFKSFFMSTPSLNLFSLYGAINKQEAASSILSDCSEALLHQWHACLLEAGQWSETDTLDSMRNNLKDIVDKALPNCLPSYEGMGDSFSMAVETKKEVHKKIEVDVRSINACYSPDLQPEELRYWGYSVSLDKPGDMALTLNQACTCQGGAEPAFFSPNLMASVNYAKTYKNQKDYLGVFLKPVFVVLYHKDASGVLLAMIVTPEESSDILNNIGHRHNIWLSTTDGCILGGKPSADFLKDSEYLSLREQVRFFNGEFSSLLHQETPLVWLNDQFAEKLHFFENELMLSRPGSMQGYQEMKLALLQGNVEGFEYIAKHPFEDCTSTSWTAIFPKTRPVEAAGYHKLACAFHLINQRWMHETLTMDGLMRQFQLPVNSLSYISLHLEKMSLYKGLLTRLHSLDVAQPLLLALSSQEWMVLEELIGMPLQTLCQSFGVEPDKKANSMAWHLASVHALLILREHPGLQGQVSLLDAYLIKIVTETSAVEVFTKIDTIKHPTPELSYALVGSAMKYNRLTVDRILNIPALEAYPFTEKMTICLASTCEKPEQVKALLAHKTANSQASLRILSRSAILDTDDFRAILLHPMADKEVVNNVLNYPTFHGDGLVHFLKDFIEIHIDRSELLEKLAAGIYEKISAPTNVVNVLSFVCLLIRLFHESTNKNDQYLVKIANETKNLAVLNILFLSEPRTQTLTDVIVHRVLHDKNIPSEFQNEMILPILALETYPFTKDMTIIIATKCIEIHQIKALLAHKTALSPASLTVILQEKYLEPADLITIFLHALTNAQVVKDLVNHASFLGVAEDLIRSPRATTYNLQILAEALFNKYAKATPDEQLEWEHYLIMLFEQSIMKDDQYLVRIATETNSVKVLSTLFAITNPSKALKGVLVRRALINNLYDDYIISRILESKYPLTLAMMESLATKCGSIAQVKQLLGGGYLCSQQFLMKLLNRTDLDEHTFRTILVSPYRNDAIFIAALNNPNFSTVAQNLIENPPDQFTLDYLERNLFVQYTSTPIDLESEKVRWTRYLILSFEKSTNKDDKYLVRIARDTQSVAVLEALFAITPASPQLMDVLVHRALVDGKYNHDIILKILTLNYPFTDEMKVSLANQCETLEQVRALLHSNNTISPEILRTIIQTEGLDERDLDVICRSYCTIPPDVFQTLAQKVTTMAQTDVLFARADMTSDIATYLFKKKPCSLKIGNWKWLTKKQLKHILNKTTDYNSLNLAFKHGNMTSDYCKKWIDKQQNIQTKAVNALDPTSATYAEEKLRVALSELRMKAFKLAIEARDNVKYVQAAQAGFELYVDLKVLVDAFLSQPAGVRDQVVFETTCTALITGKLPILEVHRGYKQALLDILNIIVTAFTLGLLVNDQDKWRFFKAKTDSVVVVGKFQQVIKP